MKQFLLYLTQFSGYKRRSFLIPIVFLMISYFATAQSAGFNNAFAILSINGGGNTYYDMNGSTANTDFNGTVLGVFSSGNSLLLKGAEHNVYRCGACDLTSTRLNYRIYVTGNTPGSFLNLGIGYFSGSDNGCGGQDQRWSNSDFSVDILSGLSAGNYTFEIFSEATTTCLTGTAYAANDGSNYKAMFTVAKAESTISVTGTTSFIYDNTPQGPSTTSVTGSTGAVTYSYVGVSPTIYAVSATPPTNPGTYTVTANVASDDNYNGASSSVTPFTIDKGLYTYIPDANFLQALITSPYNITNLGDCVLTSNVSNITELKIENKGISNLTGIEDFSSLQDLYCADNNITGSLDLSMLSNLRYLDCQYNSISSLNVTGLSNLETLVTWHNLLSSLNLSTNIKLDYLDCDDNYFTMLDVSKLTNLIQFYCSGNQLTSLDVRGLTNLANFECTDNLSLTCILVDNVAAAVLKTTTIDNDNLPPSPFWKKDSGAAYSYCKCDLTTTWTSALGGSWDNGVPTTGTYAAIISADYSQSANINACSLTVNSGAVVTIPSGFNVTLNAPITITSGSFTLNNNANLIQTNKNSINTGAINVNRDSSPLFRLDYTMWSSPVSGAQTLGGFSPLTSTNRFHEYNSATDFYNAVPSTDPFGLAKSYLIRMPNTWVDYVVSPPSTPLSWTGTFMGTPNNGDISLAVTNGTYNSIGNPYPSTISADAFISNNGITEALYFWRKKNNENQATVPTTSYATYTLAGGTGTSPSGGITPNGTIQVGQGFIAKSTSTTLKFSNTMRIANNGNQILKTRNTVERNRIWLNLANPAGAFNQMMVAYMSGATQDIDAAIDGRYFNDSKTALNSLISSEEFAIQGRALPFDGTDIVPLAFKTNLAGDYTISIDHVDGLFSGNQDIFLKDNNTGTETNLKAGAYTFNAAAGVDNARFSLKYQRTLDVNNTVFNDDSVTIHKNKGTLYVNSGSTAINNIKVFDIQGRLIAEQKNVKANAATIKDLKATQQVLIVKITSQDNKVVSKKVVN